MQISQKKLFFYNKNYKKSKMWHKIKNLKFQCLILKKIRSIKQSKKNDLSLNTFNASKPSAAVFTSYPIELKNLKYNLIVSLLYIGKGREVKLNYKNAKTYYQHAHFNLGSTCACWPSGRSECFRFLWCS